MDIAELLLELYGRIPPLARHAAAGLDLAQLTEQPSPGANTIAWLLWHTARVQDHHVGEVLGQDRIWVGNGWAGRFGLEPDPTNTGYGHGAEDVIQVRPHDAEILMDYLDAVDARTRVMLAAISPADLARVVDRRWDPPVTLGVRLVSIADDSLQHLGQAAYVRGLLDG